MIKLQLINADIIYDTAIVTSLLFRKSFNCRYNPRMDYAFCLLTLKSSEKWRSPYIPKRTENMCDFTKSVKLHTRKTIENRLLSRIDNAPISICVGAKMVSFYYCTNVFYLLSFKFSCKLAKTMTFSFKSKWQ
jgi:hypothetical protein